MMFWRQNPGETEIGGHCVAVVGYSDTDQWFIIRNSWGTGWGAHGYCYYPYNSWGAHWELYSSVDAKSEIVTPVDPPTPDPPVNNKCKCVLM
jgi:hypothetical protein